MADDPAGFAKEVLNKFGPSDEQRAAFNKSFLGRLLGQSVVLLGTVGAYLAAVAAFYHYGWETFSKFRTDIGATWFAVVLSVPIVAILLFSFLPLAWRVFAERRLKNRTLAGASFKPGYFRLFPYSSEDRASYKRLDGAAEDITNWLQSRPESLLYLSGASGSGKSSLLAAHALPALRDVGWNIVEVRLLNDALAQLREAVAGNERLFARKPAGSVTLRSLLERAAEASLAKDAKPLLIVIDQFEEFLILQKPEGQQEFIDLLKDLTSSPLRGLKLLLVFRSDYYELVFKLGLPDAMPRQNWWAIAPYGRPEATQFLKDGGRELSEQGLDGLFAGLDRIEDTPGLYRPITLNMVGLVLDNMGARIEGDPGRLIQAYLTASVRQKEIRDYAPSVLSQLISDSGTRQPLSAEAISERTGLPGWQVKATLTTLAERGLVRAITYGQTVWEISHDFLARVLGQIIGRIKQPILPKVMLAAAPVVLVSWIAVAAIAVPYWTTLQERRIEAELREQYDGTASASGAGGIDFSFIAGDTSKVRPIVDRLKRLRNVRSVRFPLYDVDLDAIAELVDVDTFTFYVSKYTNPGRLEQLAKLTSLRRLTLTDVESSLQLSKLPPIKLQRLTIQRSNLADLKAIDLLNGVEELHLDNVVLASLEGIGQIRGLRHVMMAGMTEYPPLDISFVKTLSNLDSLDLEWWTIQSLEPLRGHPNIKRLTLANLRGLSDVLPVLEISNLEAVTVRNLGYPAPNGLPLLEKRFSQKSP